MAMDLEEHCPICLGSWEEASYVMPCLHQFCYPCILQWAESKPECPLCKRRMLSILHSVRADDDYVEHVLTPSVAPPVAVRQAGGAPRHPAAHHLHHPGAPQRWAAQGVVPRRPVAVLQPPNWMNLLRNAPVLQQTLQHWVRQEMEDIFGSRGMEAGMLEDTVTGMPSNHGTGTELPGRTLGASLQNRTATFMHQRARVAVQRRSREAHRLLGRHDTRAAGGREGSPTAAPSPAASRGGSLAPGPAPAGSPERSGVDELPGSSPAALGGGPGSHPSAPAAAPVEQEEPQHEPGEAVPGPPTSRRGRERFPRRPPKRRTGTQQEASPANKRPAPQR